MENFVLDAYQQERTSFCDQKSLAGREAKKTLFTLSRAGSATGAK
jgi:hypothetical protein